jgi:hypothetical protein
MPIARYRVEAAHVDVDGQTRSRAYTNAGDGFEAARITLAAQVGALLDGDPSLRAHPDTIDFMDRPDAIEIRVYRSVEAGMPLVPLMRFTLIDRKRTHCGTCTCAVRAARARTLP